MSKLAVGCLVTFLVSIVSPSHAADGPPPPPPPDLALWYDKPAAKWEEALPVGNGRLGAMVFGGVAEERLQLNVDSLWSGGPQDADNPDALAALPKIRALLFAGKYADAQELTNKTQICKGKGDKGSFGSYSTLGDLRLSFDGHGREPRDYRRELRLEEGIARTTYQLDGVTFVRETFVSHDDQVMVTRVSATEPGKVNLRATLSRPERAEVHVVGDRDITMSGQLDNDGGPGMRYAARVRILTSGRNGTVEHDGNSIRVLNDDAVTLIFAAATDSESLTLDRDVTEQLDRAEKRWIAELRDRHLTDYQRLFARCRLDLGRSESSSLPTDQRLVKFADGGDDPALIALYFHLGRYLLMSSSRPGDLAANLQGIWAQGVTNPWNCDYHTNINVQMTTGWRRRPISRSASSRLSN